MINIKLKEYAKAADSFLPALEFVLDGLLWSCHSLL